MGKKKQQQAKDVKVVKEVSTTKEEATMEQQELVMDTPKTTEEVTFVSNLSTDDMDAVLGEDASTEETKTITDVVAELNADFEEEKDEEPSAVMTVLDDIKATKEKKDKKKGDDEVESQTIKVNLISEIERFQFTKKKTEEVVVKTMINLLSSEVEKKPVGVAVLMEMLSFVSGKESTLSPSNRTDLNDIMDQAEQDFKANATKKIASFVSKELHKMITRLELDKVSEPTAEPVAEPTEEQTQMARVTATVQFVKLAKENQQMLKTILTTENPESLWSIEVVASAQTFAQSLVKYAYSFVGADIDKIEPDRRELLELCTAHPDRAAHALLFILEKMVDADKVETYIVEMQEEFDKTLEVPVELKIDAKMAETVAVLLDSENLAERTVELMELKEAIDTVNKNIAQNAVKQEMTALEEIRAHNHSETPMTYGDYMELRIRENKARIARLRAQ